MNNSIFYFFYSLAHKSIFIDKVIIFFATYFPFIVALLAFLLILFYYKDFKELFVAFFGAGLAWFLAHVLKVLIHENRPFLSIDNIHSLFLKDTFSFPSGHAAFFGALAFSIAMHHKWAGYLFIFFALIIGIARIASGVHFPIDILAGFALGVGVAYFFRNI